MARGVLHKAIYQFGVPFVLDRANSCVRLAEYGKVMVEVAVP
jgi:hypothetical protein